MKYVPYGLVPAALLAATTTLPALAYRFTAPRANPAGLRTDADDGTAASVAPCDAEDGAEPTYPPTAAVAVPRLERAE